MNESEKALLPKRPKYIPEPYRPIWVLAAANNEKGRRVTKRMNPNCRRVGVL